MTTDIDAFERLAVRCEQATGPDPDLFADAFHSIFPRPDRVWVSDNSGPWTDAYSAWQSRQSRFFSWLDEEAYLDAAMMLVLEGWEWSVRW